MSKCATQMSPKPATEPALLAIVGATANILGEAAGLIRDAYLHLADSGDPRSSEAIASLDRALTEGEKGLANLRELRARIESILPDATAESPSAKPEGAEALLSKYRKLVDGLSNMVEGERITEADCPDDYDWLVGSLAELAALDPA